MIKLPKNEGLNIVPFIDIILVLLAIVLSISSFVAEGKIKVDLPSGESSVKMEDEKDRLLIVIDNQSKFFIDDKEQNEDDIKDRIMDLHKDTLVELKSDKNATFNSFVVIVDALKLKGHEKFQIITSKEQ